MNIITKKRQERIRHAMNRPSERLVEDFIHKFGTEIVGDETKDYIELMESESMEVNWQGKNYYIPTDGTLYTNMERAVFNILRESFALV